MTSFLLIRHGLTDAIGRSITGRLPGVHLNDEGRAQAARLPERLKRFPIGAIYSSPLERALETAGPTAEALRLPLNQSPALSEFDFGEWSGLSLGELDRREDWHIFNRFRSSTRAPGGELLTEVQTRMVTELTLLRGAHPEQTVALFSHSDAIKAALMHFLGMPIDHIHRLEISPASLSIVHLETAGVRVWAMNLSE